MEPLFALRPHGHAAPLGEMLIIHDEDGFKFLFEKPMDMAMVFVVGLPHAIVHVEESDCTTININSSSSAIWQEIWDSDQAKVTVKEFLERCGASFGNNMSSGSGSNIAGESGNMGGAGGSNRDRNDNNNNNNTNNNNQDRGSSNDTGGNQPPNQSSQSQPSSSDLPANRVRILLRVQNECGKDLEPTIPLEFANAARSNCAIAAGLDFVITRGDDWIPPLLHLELGIDADFELLSRCMVKEKGKQRHRVGVIHDELQVKYYGDTKSALSLDKARMVGVYALEVGKKKTKAKAIGGEIGGEVNVTGGHASMVSGVGKLAAKRMKMTTTTAETNEVTKVDALGSSSFTVDNTCRRPLREADVLSFTASHLPPMNTLASLEDAGLSLQEGARISTSLGKSMGMSMQGEFFCQVGQIHTHTLELSRALGEVEVTTKHTFLRRLTRRKAILKASVIEGKQSYVVKLLLNYGLDFTLYGGKKIAWIAKSFANPTPNLVDIILPSPPPSPHNAN